MDATLQVFKPERNFPITDPTSSFYRRANWGPQRSRHFPRKPSELCPSQKPDFWTPGQNFSQYFRQGYLLWCFSPNEVEISREENELQRGWFGGRKKGEQNGNQLELPLPEARAVSVPCWWRPLTRKPLLVASPSQQLGHKGSAQVEKETDQGSWDNILYYVFQVAC